MVSFCENLSLIFFCEYELIKRKNYLNIYGAFIKKNKLKFIQLKSYLKMKEVTVNLKKYIYIYIRSMSYNH